MFHVFELWETLYVKVQLHRSEPAVALAGLSPVVRPSLRTTMVRGQRHTLGHPEAPLLRHPSFCLKSPAAAFLSAREGLSPAGRLQLFVFSAVWPFSCHSSRYQTAPHHKAVVLDLGTR